jgi:uncharacterized alpha-E superfamily protein
MLSRVADSIFWMSRYIERAENVGRFIDVNFHMILEGSTHAGGEWMPLVNTTGDHDLFLSHYEIPTRESVVHFLTFDPDNPNSILSCVRAARENARTIRDTITSEMWEQMNSFYLMINDPHSQTRAADNPYDFFSDVRKASQAFVGVTDLTLSHREAWAFCRMGRLLERTDKTTRILDVKYYLLSSAMVATSPKPASQQSQSQSQTSGRLTQIYGATPQDSTQWAAVLKSTSALEMYRKHYRRITPEKVVEFLLLDRHFPRSVLFCLDAADACLHGITGTPRGAYCCPAEKMLGQLNSALSYKEVEEVIEPDLHVFLDELQTKLNEIGIALHETFFEMQTSRHMDHDGLMSRKPAESVFSPR